MAETVYVGLNRLISFTSAEGIRRSDPNKRLTPGTHSFSAVIMGLEEMTSYYYSVGKASEMVRSFTVPPSSSHPLTFGVVGDLGLYYSAPFVRQALIQDHSLDVMIIPGDISYADGNAAKWDRFMDLFEPLFSRLPLLVEPGNHETIDEHYVWEDREYGAYLARFNTETLASNSNSSSPLYYSVDVAGVHFVFVNAEFDRSSFQPGQAQHEWIRADLEAAAARRAQDPLRYPWIVVVQHRNMYSSTVASESCWEF